MALYQGGAFSAGLSLEVPYEPLSLDSVLAISALAGTSTNNVTTTPCLAIMSGQDTGYLLTPAPETPGFAFLPSNGMCPCESCIRITRCCGNILNADGSIAAVCYNPVQCDKAGACLRNFQCLGVTSSNPIIQPGNIASFVTTTPATTPPPCFKFSPAPAGTNGFMVNRVIQGVGVTVQTCTPGTSCLAVVPCCATAKKPCLSFTPCCIPPGQQSSTACLSVDRCDIPNPNPTTANAAAR